MAKVGILSMQRIINYGSFLQAYGLKKILEELGHEVEFVDYRTGEPLVTEGKKKKKGLAGKVDKGLEALRYDAPLRHRIQFIFYKKRFADRYHSVLGLKKEMNYTPELDALVIGSDEVFNCVQANPNVGYSPEIFGKNHRAKRLISYAASFGNTTAARLEQYQKTEEVGEWLNRFDAVSVRDENSGSVVEKLTGREAEYHLDPVLVYDYMGTCGRIPRINPKEKYLIVYAYAGRISEEESKWISAYAKENGWKVYAIGGVQRCADRFVDCSPFEVPAYFLHAEAVITDTFHGSIFSIITRRQFVALVRKSIGTAYGNEEKLTDLLRRLGLEERIAKKIEDAEMLLKKQVDYTGAERVIRQEREHTYRYLERQLATE